MKLELILRIEKILILTSLNISGHVSEAKIVFVPRYRRYEFE
jgi:hypothetical protein